MTSLPRPVRAALVALGLAIATLHALPAPVAAHAELASSSPEAGASLIEPPAELELRFTEPIDPATVTVELHDASRAAVAGLGPLRVTEGVVVTTALPALEPGAYTVSYQVISAVDGHVTSGMLAFVVDPTGTQAAPTVTASSTSPSVDAATVIARWVGLAGVLIALGSLVMWWNAGRPGSRPDAATANGRPPWFLIAVASCAGFVGVAIYLGLAARPIVAALGGGHGGYENAGFPLDFAAPFGWTPFAVAMRVALAASLAAFGVALARVLSLRARAGGPGEDRGRAISVGLLLAVALAGMSMAGHAAASGGPAFGAIDWAHLVSVAAWLGALPAAFVLASRAAAARGAAMRAILRRHGRVALLAAPVTVITGLANSPLVLGSSRDLVASGYGNILLAKAVLLAVALGLGAVNHLSLRDGRRHDLRLLVGAELLVALVAVLAGATMVTIQPASARQPVALTPPAAPAHLYAEAGPLQVHAAVSLAAPGLRTYQVEVTDLATAAPRDDVQSVFLTFTPPPSADITARRIELAPAARPGLYGATGDYTPVEGAWRLEVTVRVGAGDERAAFDLPVTAPVAAELAPPPDTGLGVPAPLAMLWSVLPAGPAAWIPALVAASATAAAAWSTRRRGAPRWLPALRLALVGVLALAVVGAGSRALVSAANAAIPDDLPANPTVADLESIATGERLYLANCAGCHGRDGSGGGAVVTQPPAGPLGEAVRSASDGALSYRIAVGVGGTPMPGFAGIITPDERWHLINYLRDRFGRD